MADPNDDLLDTELLRREKLRKLTPMAPENMGTPGSPAPAPHADASTDETLFEKLKKVLGLGRGETAAAQQGTALHNPSPRPSPTSSPSPRF
jgi:hypothetical protein